MTQWENPFPFVRAARGGCTSGNQTLQLHGSSCRTDWYVRPVPAKGKYQGCVAEYLQEPVSALIYCPLTLTLLLTDLTRSQRSLGLMTQTRAGFMTRDPRKEDVVTIPRVVADVLKRPNLFLQDLICLHYFFPVYNC